MTNSGVLDGNGKEMYEGILERVISSLIGKERLVKKGRYENCKKRCMYMVKGKMEGWKEVGFVKRLFN
ncbi:hypothetical protein [Priestia megaterium]|uniref:hypothetical protein n=1 Tax=Priestia megaterium TaxID=1404 RepID=UPI001F3CCAC5|nr:hypothetical protein [Priestia megaterium]